MNAFEVDWLGIIFPGGCLQGGYIVKLAVTGAAPLLLLLVVFVVSVLYGVFRRCRDRDSSSSPLEICTQSVFNGLPLVLFICYCMCASISSSIFASWGCIEYVEDAMAEPPLTQSFLRVHPAMKCFDGGSQQDEYGSVLRLASLFVIIWPCAMPVLFMSLLLAIRRTLQQGRITRLIRATAFLHREYEPAFFWWEPFFLVQRLLLVGFVQIVRTTSPAISHHLTVLSPHSYHLHPSHPSAPLTPPPLSPPPLSPLRPSHLRRFQIPRGYEYVRILVGFLFTIMYLAALLSMQPYKRLDNDMLAVGMQTALVLIFFMSQSILLFNELVEAQGVSLTLRVLGFGSLDRLVQTLVVSNLTVLVAFVALLIYQSLSHRSVPLLRLVATKQPPELKLAQGMTYHLFLSHIWSTGQDTVAVIKRQLNLLMPGVIVFLDVDDLEEIGNLEQYVAASQCVLILLSRGYFFSANCLREINYAIAMNKPLILVHEPDPGKGGLPLAELREDCESKGVDVEYIFDRRWPIITWQRVSEFQMLSLRLIAEGTIEAMPGVLDETSNIKYAQVVGPTDPPPGSQLYIPGEITRRQLHFKADVVLYVSTSDPGAEAFEEELLNSYGGLLNFTTTRRPPASFVPFNSSQVGSRNDSRRKSRSSTGLDRSTARRDASNSKVTHMLLYLTDDVFRGEAGQVLAHEVQQAWAHSIPIVLVHEIDPARNGCDFGRFFQTTPQELISAGLYKTIAVACHPLPHRAVSLPMVAVGCGARLDGQWLVTRLRKASSLGRSMSDQKRITTLKREQTVQQLAVVSQQVNAEATSAEVELDDLNTTSDPHASAPA